MEFIRVPVNNNTNLNWKMRPEYESITAIDKSLLSEGYLQGLLNFLVMKLINVNLFTTVSLVIGNFSNDIQCN